MEQEPTLFEVEASTPQDVLDDKAFNARMWDKLDEILHTAEELRDKSGIYLVVPPPELRPRIKAYLENNTGKVAAALSGVSDDTRNAVLYDYAATLSGACEYNATLEQMQETLRAVKPFKAFQIDRYGLYLALLMQYSRTLRVFDDYRRNMVDTDTHKIPAKDKAAYMARTTTEPAEYFRAFQYLKRQGYATPLDFVGCETSDVRAFLDYAQELADLSAYGTFYIFGRALYSATAEELAAIQPPPTFETALTHATQWAEKLYFDTQEQLNKVALKVAEFIDAETQAEREKAKAEAEAAEENARTLALKEIPLIINSRPVNIAVEGDVSKQFPVQAYIDDFTKKNPTYKNPDNGKSLITPMVVQQVFEAINLLSAYGRIDTKSGRYDVDTTIEELSRIVGYADANGTELKALFGGLQLFHNLYVVVDRPYKFTDIVTKNGKKRKKTGGPTAINVMQLAEVGIETGHLKLYISPEALKGKPVYITENTYKQLKKRAKGAAQSRFNAQLLTKGHKNENELVAEVFGYDSMQRNAELIKNADDRATELKRVKTYIQNHRSDDKKKVAKWFKQYAAEGILTYDHIKATTGKEYNYQWTVTRPEGLAISEAATEEPDEQ